MTADQQRELSETPLREIPPWLIREYTNSAHGRPNNPDEFKYLLPRYFELMEQGECPSDLCWEVALDRIGDMRKDRLGLTGRLRGFFKRLAGARISAFSEEEDSFIERFLDEFLHETIAGTTPLVIDECLIMMANAGSSLDGVVARIVGDRSGLGAREIASLIVSDGGRALLKNGRLDSAHWNRCEAAMQSVVAQLDTTSSSKYLLSAMEQEDDTYWRDLLQRAYDVLVAETRGVNQQHKSATNPG